PGRVGEVDDPRVRAYGCDPLRDVDRHRHGAQPVGDPARAGRLLTEQAEVEGDAFVRGAALEATHPDGGEHERGAAKRVVQVGGGAHLGRAFVTGGHRVEDHADRQQSLRIYVVP